MKYIVKNIDIMSGGELYPIGSEIELTAKEAEKLLKKGYLDPIEKGDDGKTKGGKK